MRRAFGLDGAVLEGDISTGKPPTVSSIERFFDPAMPNTKVTGAQRSDSIAIRYSPCWRSAFLEAEPCSLRSIGGKVLR